MTKVLLTPSTVEMAKCPAGKRKLDLFDQRTKGLLLEVRETGGRTYYLRYTNARGKVRQHRLADARDVTLAQARQLADQTRNRIAMGEDPAEARSALRTVPTFAQFIENDFLPHIRLHKRSWHCDVSLLNNHLLPFLGSMHMDSIGRRDIQRVISDRREQGKAPAPATAS